MMNMLRKLNMKPMSVVVALLILILVLHLYNRWCNIVEGLANPADTEFIAKGIKNDIVSLQDALHIDKYQGNYQEIVKDMIQWCDLSLLKSVVSNKVNIEKGVSADNTELIRSLNQYSLFKETLQNVYNNILTTVPSN